MRKDTVKWNDALGLISTILSCQLVGNGLPRMARPLFCTKKYSLACLQVLLLDIVYGVGLVYLILNSAIWVSRCVDVQGYGERQEWAVGVGSWDGDGRKIVFFSLSMIHVMECLRKKL